jgi:preprotein translocase subunit SecG
MLFIIYVLAFVMFVDCMLLILLVLMQLPKKEAGAGLAFGGAATDALFGAGSGNFLTKATKWAAAVFFVLALTLAVMQSRYYHRSGAQFRETIEQKPSASSSVTLPETPAPSGQGSQTNLELLAVPPAATSTNATPR